MAQNLQFCTFYLDNLLFGVPLTDVQEVMQHTGDDPCSAGAERGERD